MLTIYGQRADSEPVNVLGVLLALLAIASGVLALCTNRISYRLPESYFRYRGESVRPWWVNGYFFYRKSSRRNWVKATSASFYASLVVFGVAAAIAMD